MRIIILVVIYISFIGLGIPDSLLGSAWPAMYKELSLPVSYASIITTINCIGTVISSMFSAKIINKLGTGKVTAISTAMTALGLLGFSYSNDMIWLCAFSIPLGLGAGAIDTALNNYVAVNYNAVHMNFLHCFYGVGVSVSPFFMSLALARTGWRDGYKIVFLIQMLITIITVISLPVWTKVHSNSNTDNVETRTVSFRELIKSNKIKSACMVFIGSCGIEFTCGVWGSTFLVVSKNMSVDRAALMITFYYVGIALSRFLSGVLATKLTSRQLINMGVIIVLVAIIWLIVPFSAELSAVGLFLVGLGNGTIFPNMTHLTPEHFGEDISQSVMGLQMAVSYIGVLFMPLVFGVIAQNIGAWFFPFYLLFMYLIMMFGDFMLKKYHKSTN